MAMYSVNRPVLFAKKAVHIMSTERGLNAREKQAKQYIKTYTKSIPEPQARIMQDKIRRSEIRAKSEVFRDVEFDKMDEDVLMRKYNDKARVQRAIRTEAHEQAEAVKVEQAKTFGVTEKIWMTQRDNRVRDTGWHNAVDGMRVPIDGEFVAAGMRASHPGDIRLPIGERINCRCYLTYQ
jgi:hypothetical protein